jgi:hypothetical protein
MLGAHTSERPRRRWQEPQLHLRWGLPMLGAQTRPLLHGAPSPCLAPMNSKTMAAPRCLPEPTDQYMCLALQGRSGARPTSAAVQKCLPEPTDQYMCLALRGRRGARPTSDAVRSVALVADDVVGVGGRPCRLCLWRGRPCCAAGGGGGAHEPFRPQVWPKWLRYTMHTCMT